MMKGNAWTRISDQFPTSCKDYFNRDNLFAGASINVPVVVTIDPDGPGTAGSAVVNCVKTSSTEVCTRVSRQQSLYRDLIFYLKCVYMIPKLLCAPEIPLQLNGQKIPKCCMFSCNISN